MSYGKINKLLTEKCEGSHACLVLIESIFKETTRTGVRWDAPVMLALTPVMLVIASEKYDQHPSLQSQDSVSKKYIALNQKYEISSMHPIETIQMKVFKKTKRQALKIVFYDRYARYFELGDFEKRQVFWNLWRYHISELIKGPTTWPYLAKSGVTDSFPKALWDRLDYIEFCTLKQDNKTEMRPRWTDKYLYLGLNREAEDEVKPTPISGLDLNDDCLYTYLKPVAPVASQSKYYEEHK